MPKHYPLYFGIIWDLYIYDAGVEQEIVSPEIVSETISVPTQNTSWRSN